MSDLYQGINMVAQLGNDQNQNTNLASDEQRNLANTAQPAEQQQPIGAPPATMPLGGPRAASAQSYATADGDMEDLSEDSLLVSPEEKKRPQRARPGTRSTSASRSRKTSTALTRPLSGRARSDTTPAVRPPRPRLTTTTNATAISAVPAPRLVAPSADTPEARLAAL